VTNGKQLVATVEDIRVSVVKDVLKSGADLFKLGQAITVSKKISTAQLKHSSK